MQEQMSAAADLTFGDEPNFRLIRVTGDDAEQFLQGQLTQNVRNITADKAVWCAACNYQGRAASTAMIFRIPGGFAMLMSASVAELELKRLKMYVLRSKVTIEIAETPVRFVLASDVAAEAAGFPAEDMQTLVGKAASVVRLPKIAGSDKAAFVFFGDFAADAEADQLASYLMSAGVILIEKDMSLQWLPQALNMDLIGAVSLNKGCYNGQEVINKTQSLGRIKRRMALGSADVENVAAGTEILSDSDVIGEVIASRGNRFLFVAEWSEFDSELTVAGKPVTKIAFPYEVNVPKSVI